MAQPRKTGRDRRRRDRRNRVDPRYRNPNYPDYVDRRCGVDRRCDDDCKPGFLDDLYEKGPRRGLVIILGAAAAGIWAYLFVLAVVNLRRFYF